MKYNLKPSQEKFTITEWLLMSSYLVWCLSIIIPTLFPNISFLNKLFDTLYVGGLLFINCTMLFIITRARKEKRLEQNKFYLNENKNSMITKTLSDKGISVEGEKELELTHYFKK